MLVVCKLTQKYTATQSVCVVSQYGKIFDTNLFKTVVYPYDKVSLETHTEKRISKKNENLIRMRFEMIHVINITLYIRAMEHRH
jgi:hypothetical protein